MFRERVWYRLVGEHFAPAKLVQSAPGRAEDDTDKPARRDPRGRIDVVDLDLSRYPALARRAHGRALAGQSLLKMGLETRSPAYNDLIARIERAATGPAVPILLWGETGVGKSALARRIYELRKRGRSLEGCLLYPSPRPRD